jgi:hypothetical protein
MADITGPTSSIARRLPPWIADTVGGERQLDAEQEYVVDHEGEQAPPETGKSDVGPGHGLIRQLIRGTHDVARAVCTVRLGLRARGGPDTGRHASLHRDATALAGVRSPPTTQIGVLRATFSRGNA